MTARVDDDRLLPLAESISDRAAVDWTAAARQLDASDTAVLDELRVLDRIASVHTDTVALSATEAAIIGLEMCRERTADVLRVGKRLYLLTTGVRFDEAGAPLREMRPDLPEVFTSVVDKATAADPAQRYASPALLEAALSSAALATREELLPPERSSGMMTATLTVLLAAALAGTAYCGIGR